MQSKVKVIKLELGNEVKWNNGIPRANIKGAEVVEVSPAMAEVFLTYRHYEKGGMYVRENEINRYFIPEKAINDTIQSSVTGSKRRTSKRNVKSKAQAIADNQ